MKLISARFGSDTGKVVLTGPYIWKTKAPAKTAERKTVFLRKIELYVSQFGYGMLCQIIMGRRACTIHLQSVGITLLSAPDRLSG